MTNKPQIRKDTKKDKCNCIVSGYAQTTNYCKVHKHQPMTKPQIDWMGV